MKNLIVVTCFLSTLSLQAGAKRPASPSRGSQAAVVAGRLRIKEFFETAKVAYPPQLTTLLYLKDQKKLIVYAGDKLPLVKVRTFDVLAASGGPGPKLRQGDNQVPEGIYRIEGLNPGSQFHLSLRVNYPNPFDQANARKEGRTDLGGDIMIHGDAVSIGCIAIGDVPIEELFALATDTKFSKWKVLLAPTDLRKPKAIAPVNAPAWMLPEYVRLKEEMSALP